MTGSAKQSRLYPRVHFWIASELTLLAMTAEQISQSEKEMANTPPFPEDRIPVIIGVGEIVDRPKDLMQGLEPLTLLEEALKRAEADSGTKLLHEVGSLDVVN